MRSVIIKQIARILIFVLVLSISFSGVGTTFANSQDSVSRDVVKINEFELYSNLQAKSNSELLKMGYTNKMIEYLRNFNFEEKLKERAQLDEKSLKVLGYNKEEIENLKNVVLKDDLSMKLNGGSDSGGSYATLTLETSLDYKTDDTVVIDFNWNWDHSPLYNGHDIVGFAWEGTSDSGEDINVRINRDYSYHNITMQHIGGTENQSADIDVDNEYHSAYSKFDMSYPVNYGNNAFAESGSGQIMLNKTGTLPINEVAMNIEYGHQVIIGSPSVSFPGGLSMSFSTSISEIANVSDIYK